MSCLSLYFRFFRRFFAFLPLNKIFTSDGARLVIDSISEVYEEEFEEASDDDDQETSALSFSHREERQRYLLLLLEVFVVELNEIQLVLSLRLTQVRCNFQVRASCGKQAPFAVASVLRWPSQSREGDEGGRAR